MCEAMAKCIRKTVEEILGTSRRGGNKMKGTWWWKEEVKERVNEKKDAYAASTNNGTDEKKKISRFRYKVTKNVAKKAIAVAKSMAYDRAISKIGDQGR